MELEEIKKLADLARIDMSEEEMLEIAKDFKSILAYVDQIKEVSKNGNLQSISNDKNNYFIRNVGRDDIVTNKGGEFTQDILADAPDTKDGFLKVKQIL